MLSTNDENILEEIVAAQGKCISSTRCRKCPFRSMCLPEFLYPNPPSANQRFNMAMDVLAHNALVDATTSIEDFKGSFRGITSNKQVKI